MEKGYISSLIKMIYEEIVKIALIEVVIIFVEF